MRASDSLDRCGEYVADAAFGADDAWCARIALQLAPQSEDLHIDAAVENILVHPSCLQQVLAAQRPLTQLTDWRLPASTFCQ